MFSLSLGVLFLQLLQIGKLRGQQCGDVRLDVYGVPQTNHPELHGLSRLEIFRTHWIPVCYEQFDYIAATVACRQMGYCGIPTIEEGSNCKFVNNIQYKYISNWHNID